METNLKDKVLFIAASSKGLGYGIAEEAALCGAKIFLGSRNMTNIDKALQSLKRVANIEAKGEVLNAARASSIKNWIKAGLDEFGTIDGLVVNAGGPGIGTFDNLEDSDWEDAFELTLMSAVRMIREVLPIMKAKKKGSILTITSSSVKEPIQNLLLSNVMRSGVANLAKSLSFELGKHNIRVNNIVPGRIDTERVRNLDAYVAKSSQRLPEEVKQELEANVPLGKYGTVNEFGKASVFLLSDAASYITGETLVVDGGSMRTIW